MENKVLCAVFFAVVTIFEPLFLLLVIVAAIMFVRVAVSAIQGRRADARRTLTRLAIVAAIYMVAVLLVSMATPRRIYQVGDTQCFDDWCIAVTSATRPTPARVAVGLRLSSRAKRAPQRERGTIVYLIDSEGHRYDPVAAAIGVPLDTMLQPGQAVEAQRTFAVGRDARGLGLVYTHQGGFPIGFFIIGENEWAHGPAVVQLRAEVGESSVCGATSLDAACRDMFNRSPSSTQRMAMDSTRAANLALEAVRRDSAVAVNARPSGFTVASVKLDSAGFLVTLFPVSDTGGTTGYRLGSGGGDVTVRVRLDGHTTIVARGE